MTKQFTKYEAIEFLGETVQFKKRWSKELEGVEIDFVDVGELARVDFVQDEKGFIRLTLASIFDDVLRSFDKSDFEKYCYLLKPEITAHVCVG